MPNEQWMQLYLQMWNVFHTGETGWEFDMGKLFRSSLSLYIYIPPTTGSVRRRHLLDY